MEDKKKNILKSVIEKQQLPYSGTTIQMTEDFLSENMEARKKW